MLRSHPCAPDAPDHHKKPAFRLGAGPAAVEKEAAEQARQNAYVQEEPELAGDPFGTVRRQAAAGHDHMDTYAPILANPGNDVDLIASTLQSLDFEVTSHDNLTRNEIGRSLSIFLRETQGADVTLFYFAGHGLQFEGRNYLVGTDARLEIEFDIDSEALQLDQIIRLLEKNSRAALIFVDACRDNPLANTFYRENFSETRALATRGLAPISQAYQGSMITFSASPGQVAYDGTGAHSPFAVALARHLPTENQEVLSLMKRVIRDVKADTQDRQTPMVTNDLTAEVYMKLGAGGEGSLLALEQERALFDAATDLNSVRAWDVFLQRYPAGTMREMALAAKGALQNEVLASVAGVSVSELKPAQITRETAAAIEGNLGLSRDDNRAVQRSLNKLGYNAGPEDGVMGRRTREALANYQLSLGLPATGVVTQNKAQRLGLELDEVETGDRALVSSTDARRYDPAKLALIESDPRLLKAAKVLLGKEYRYGYFDGSLYLAVLDWSHPSFDGASRLARRAGGYLTAIGSRAENQFVAELSLADERLWRPNSKRSSMFGPTLGLYQLPNSREPAGGWVWSNGEDVRYLSWHPSEPTNHNDNESTVLFFIPYEQFDQYRARPRPLVWGDVSGSLRSYVIEIE